MTTPDVRPKTATAESVLADRRRVAEHEIGHALVAIQLEWSVGRVSAVRHGNISGSCTSAPPPGRSRPQALLEEAMIKIAGPIACSTAGDQQADVNRFLEIVSEIAFDDREAQLLRAWLTARTRNLLERPMARRAAGELQGRLEAAGFELDLNWSGRAETKPAVTFAPVLNITMPEQPPAEVTVNVPPPPDKRVLFSHNSSGELVEAITETAA